MGANNIENLEMMICRGNATGNLVSMEMERDSFISHGASAILRDRLCDASDAYEAIICANCRTFAILDIETKENICRECKAEAQFMKVKIPYILKFQIQLLWGAGHNTKIKVEALKDVK